MKTNKRFGNKHYPLSIIHYPFLLIAAIISSAALTANAAEIRLLSEPVRCTNMLVTLAEVAEIVPAAGDDVQGLRQTVLFTAPALGEEKTLDAVEIRDILTRLGIGSLRHRVTGAGSVTLIGNVNTAKPASQVTQAVYSYNSLTPSGIQTVSAALPETRPATQPAASNPPVRNNALRHVYVTPQLLRTLEQQIGEAIGVYLNFKNDGDEKLPWRVAVKLSQEQGRLLASSGQITDIFGGSNPPTGSQRFGVRMQATDPTTGQNTVVTVDAEVTLPREVVVVRRSLPKGFIIGPNDVALRRVDNLKGEDFFVDLKEVVGRETTKAVTETAALTPSTLRKPVWVRKGEVVTIRAVNGGITVRTEVLALADGCEGDTIPVETINPNQSKRGRRGTADTASFLARVCEPRTVEVHSTANLVVN